jgi:hypothetical protein
MTKSLLLSSFAAAALALTVSACDEQQATDSTSAPVQQQGAMPDDSGSGATMAPQTSEPQAMEPQGMESDTMEPGAMEPETMEPRSEEPDGMQPGTSQ